MKWFGVKTAYLTTVRGKPINTDKLYDGDSALLEERVIIIKAQSAEKAISKGNKEAKTYSKGAVYENPYGQKVFMEYLKACVVFELYEPPNNCSEVFSATRVIKGKLKAELIKNMIFGAKESRIDLHKRKKFLNAELKKQNSQNSGARHEKGDR